MAKQAFSTEYGLRERAVIERLGSDQLYREMRAAGWLRPVVHRHKLLLFDAGHVAQAWARILAGELPGGEKGGAGANGRKN